MKSLENYWETEVKSIIFRFDSSLNFYFIMCHYYLTEFTLIKWQ